SRTPTIISRYIFSFYGLVSACATLFLPLAVDLGHMYVSVARMLQGFSIAIAFVTVGAITSHWSAHRESGTYIAMLSSAAQVSKNPCMHYEYPAYALSTAEGDGPLLNDGATATRRQNFRLLSSVLTLPVAGAFCESSLGWRYLYYTFGAIGLLLSLMFFIFYKDDPRKHRMVSSKELSTITLGKDDVPSTKEPVPYKAILKDHCMQAVLLTTFSGNTAFFIFLQFGPTFMNMALNFDVTETGFVTALPYALCLVLKFVAGPLFDLATFIPEKYRMIMFASISQGFMSICFCILSQTRNKLIAQIAYSGAVACNGLNIVGSIKCAQVVARQHVHFVIVCITLFGTIISFILPVLVTILCPNNTVDEWSRLFLGVSGFVIITNIPFLFLARGEPAPWTKSIPKYSANLEQGFRRITDDEKFPQDQKYPSEVKFS
ncbi:unnamed protein product, partial [Strongylus vulgaris]